jgi:predicted RNA-binding Zn-ribbon protein involved in translation (DUF1610 family)
MARRRLSPRCRNCGLLRLPDERFTRNLCPSCLNAERSQRRRATGAQVLANARDAGTVERDGQTFRVVQLPPTRMGGRRIR